jgi:hypothetical protein
LELSILSVDTEDLYEQTPLVVDLLHEVTGSDRPELLACQGSEPNSAGNARAFVLFSPPDVYDPVALSGSFICPPSS